MSEISLDSGNGEEEGTRTNQAGDVFHHYPDNTCVALRKRGKLFFDDEVGQFSAGSFIEDLYWVADEWREKRITKPIEVHVCSPGGSVPHGLAVYDTIKELNKGGVPIDTYVRGYAASMGGILLQAGRVRYATKHAWLLIHEVSTLAIGTTSDIEDEYKIAKRFQVQLLDILSERSTKQVSDLKKHWERKNWWLNTTEMLEFGFVDEVI